MEEYKTMNADADTDTRHSKQQLSLSPKPKLTFFAACAAVQCTVTVLRIMHHSKFKLSSR
jgi:hypothetical protein